MTRTLAFGDDGSNGAERCWQWISASRWDGWSLEVVTADPPVDLHPVNPVEATLRPWEPDNQRKADLGFDSILHLRTELDPRVALISRAWNLVAIGPRGDGGGDSLRLGSTADWLLREPTSPLVIARQLGPVRNVLLAADGSRHVQRTIDTLVSLPWIEGLNVRVLAVDDGRVDHETVVEDAATALSSSGALVETVVRSGRPTGVLIDEIETSRPDLVAMGARGHHGLKRLLVGSTTAAVASSTDRSLLVAHATADVAD